MARDALPAGAQGDVAVSLQQISKAFGAVTALHPTTLDIRKGEFFSLLGPSGCGKTTLLRIIGGFEVPTSGDLWIGGHNVVGDPPYRRRTNMIFQHLALFPHLTVAQNIAFGLEMQRQPRRMIRERVSEALALVRLSDYGDRAIDALSGGQRQRIAVARALVNDPEVLLLDEPLGSLDLQLRLQMQQEFRRIHRDTGSTFIFVTHDQGEAIAMSDRIAVMNAGRVLQVGTPSEVYERPEHRFVAEFMGHSNFISGKVTDIKADRVGTVTASPDIRLTCRVPYGVETESKVLVALRYEKVEILSLTQVSASRSDVPSCEVAGQLISETYLGPTIRHEVLLGGDLRLVADSGNTGTQRAVSIGAPVRVRWPVDSATVIKD